MTFNLQMVLATILHADCFCFVMFILLQLHAGSLRMWMQTQQRQGPDRTLSVFGAMQSLLPKGQILTYGMAVVHTATVNIQICRLPCTQLGVDAGTKTKAASM